MKQVEVGYWWRQVGQWAGWSRRIVWLVVVAVLVVGADVVAAVVVPQAGWEWVGLVVVVGVGQWTLEEAGRREPVVEVQSGPAFLCLPVSCSVLVGGLLP